MKKKLYTFAMVVCLAVFVVCVGMIVKYYGEGWLRTKSFNDLKVKVANQEADYKKAKLDHYKELKAQNPDFTAWIKIEGTQIDFPVMHTPEDNEFYLWRNFNKEDNRGGTPFIDQISSVNPPSDNILIHGHHMKDGTMFAVLENYKNEDYYKEHPIIEFDTVDELAKYQIISVFKADVSIGNNDFHYYTFANAATPQEFDDYVNTGKGIAYYDTGHTASYGDKLITISTCEYSSENGRLVIVAKKLPPS